MDSEIENHPDFAVICSFFSKFGKQLDLEDVLLSDICNWISESWSKTSKAVDTMIKLMRKTGMRVDKQRWHKFIIKAAMKYDWELAVELQTAGFQTLSVSRKLKILKMICEMQFDDNMKFKAVINTEEADDQRVKPVGRDENGLVYWHQEDTDLNIRLYIEDEDDDDYTGWKVVCRTKDEIGNLISKLNDDPEDKIKGENSEEEEDIVETKFQKFLKTQCTPDVQDDKKTSISSIKSKEDQEEDDVKKIEETQMKQTEESSKMNGEGNDFEMKVENKEESSVKQENKTIKMEVGDDLNHESTIGKADEKCLPKTEKGLDITKMKGDESNIKAESIASSKSIVANEESTTCEKQSLSSETKKVDSKVQCKESPDQGKEECKESPEQGNDECKESFERGKEECKESPEQGKEKSCATTPINNITENTSGANDKTVFQAHIVENDTIKSQTVSVIMSTACTENVSVSQLLNDEIKLKDVVLKKKHVDDKLTDVQEHASKPSAEKVEEVVENNIERNIDLIKENIGITTDIITGNEIVQNLTSEEKKKNDDEMTSELSIGNKNMNNNDNKTSLESVSKGNTDQIDKDDKEIVQNNAQQIVEQNTINECKLDNTELSISPDKVSVAEVSCKPHRKDTNSLTKSDTFGEKIDTTVSNSSTGSHNLDLTNNKSQETSVKPIAVELVHNKTCVSKANIPADKSQSCNDQTKSPEIDKAGDKLLLKSEGETSRVDPPGISKSTTPVEAETDTKAKKCDDNNMDKESTNLEEIKISNTDKDKSIITKENIQSSDNDLCTVNKEKTSSQESKLNDSTTCSVESQNKALYKIEADNTSSTESDKTNKVKLTDNENTDVTDNKQTKTEQLCRKEPESSIDSNAEDFKTLSKQPSESRNDELVNKTDNENCSLTNKNVTEKTGESEKCESTLSDKSPDPTENDSEKGESKEIVEDERSKCLTESNKDSEDKICNGETGITEQDQEEKENNEKHVEEIQQNKSTPKKRGKRKKRSVFRKKKSKSSTVKQAVNTDSPNQTPKQKKPKISRLEQLKVEAESILHKEKSSKQSEGGAYTTRSGRRVKSAKKEDTEVWQSIEDDKSKKKKPESDADEDFEYVERKRGSGGNHHRSEKVEPVKEIKRIVNNDTPCMKCGLYSHPETILLCDGCDKGHHMACLTPPLMLVPYDEWFCPKCSQEKLIKRLKEIYEELDGKLKLHQRKTRQNEYKKIINEYTGISQTNIIPEKPKPVKSRPPPKKRRRSYTSESDVYSSEPSSPEIITTRRCRTKKISYDFSTFDKTIMDAIKDDIHDKSDEPDEKPISGKDIRTIIAAEKGKDLYDDNENQTKNDDDDYTPGRRKKRNLTNLNSSGSEAAESGSNYSLSASEEEPSDDEFQVSGASDSDDSLGGRRSKRRKRPYVKPIKRSKRLRRKRIQEEYETSLSESSEYEEIISKKTKKKKRDDYGRDSTEDEYVPPRLVKRDREFIDDDEEEEERKNENKDVKRPRRSRTLESSSEEDDAKKDENDGNGKDVTKKPKDAEVESSDDWSSLSSNAARTSDEDESDVEAESTKNEDEAAKT